jgi:hypothetical protein
VEIANLILERRPADDHRFLTSYFAVYDSFAHSTPIYRVLAEEIGWGAVFPGDEWSIPMIDADFLRFTSKLVHI